MSRRIWQRRRDWWDEGIEFTCIPDCGKCCDEPDGIVYLSRADAEKLATHHEITVEEWLQRDCRQTIDGRYILKSRESDGICIYLDDEKKCQVYPAKPAQCSAFPWWAENLRSERSWRKTKKLCPGIDHPDAIKIDGETINLWVEADLNSTIGFSHWKPKTQTDS